MTNTQDYLSLVYDTDPSTRCDINLVGGGIMDLFIKDTQILYSGPRPDGGIAFTHPCIPNFNLAKDLPNHGPARKELWKKIDATTIAWEMTAIDGIYQEGITAQRSFSLTENSCTVVTTIENKGKQSLPINIAEHTYFTCPTERVKDITINGVPFSKEAQQANAQFNPWQNNSNIYIPGTGNLSFTTSGYDAFAQWSQPGAPFACIEPIQVLPPQPEQFMNDAPLILPQQVNTYSYTLTLN
jgi:galactose mutarotase-like enzyme